MVCSPHDDINFFNLVDGVLQGDILELYMLISCLDYVLYISIKEDGFTLKKTSR